LSTTTVYVTHDQIKAMTMADKIVAHQDGLEEQIGMPCMTLLAAGPDPFDPGNRVRLV